MGRTKYRVTNDVIKNVIELRREGMQRAQIAELVGISGCTVGKILREHGMTRQKYNAYKAVSNVDKSSANNVIPAHLKGLEAYKPREIFAYLRLLGYRGKLNFTQEIDI